MGLGELVFLFVVRWWRSMLWCKVAPLSAQLD